MGKGQAGGPASSRGPAHLGLDGGPHPGRSQAPATAGRAEGQRGEREAASGAAALHHAQAQGLCARPSRGLGPGGHPGPFPPCRGDVEAIHRPRHGFALGRDGGLLSRHSRLRPAVFGHPSGPDTVSDSGASGGWGLGVVGGGRGGVRGAGDFALRAAASLAQAQRACGAGQQDPHGGVLRGVRTPLDGGLAQRPPSRVGASL